MESSNASDSWKILYFILSIFTQNAAGMHF
jgi:hypothetical protein